MIQNFCYKSTTYILDGVMSSTRIMIFYVYPPYFAYINTKGGEKSVFFERLFWFSALNSSAGNVAAALLKIANSRHCHIQKNDVTAL